MGYFMVRISNLAVFIMVGLMGMIYVLYVRYTILNAESYMESIESDVTEKILYPDKKQPRIKKIGDLWTGNLGKYDVLFNICFLVLLLYIIGMVISLFTGCFYYFDSHNYYHRNEQYFWLTQMSGLFVLGILNIVILLNKKRIPKSTMIALGLYTLSPIIAVIIQLWVYGLSLLNFAAMVSVCLVYGVASIKEYKFVELQAAKIVEQGRELHTLTAKNMISQIGPHFVFNTLTTIKYLCKQDPDMAQEAVDEFAKYLRNNIDSLSNQRMIPFDKEMEHISNYLSIEKKRFGDDIKVIYDLRNIDFSIPCLTLQPLVENAVKYGVTQNEDGGTIIISAEVKADEVLITVEDDGPGFDFSHSVNSEGYYVIDKGDGREHIGIANVQKRLEILCKGKLMIESKVGEGTRAEIRFNKSDIRQDAMVL
ncbi:MAG: histidine kinase [Lachnospiraceae bacterium]|nr:histidine kinase [Lachnospiraceae bacterium]